MTTIADLIDRAQRDWLEGSEDQPTRAQLNGAITDVATSLVYDPTLLAPEELELLGPGTLIEIGSEEIIVGAIDEDTNTLSDLVRGANGTTKATHADKVFIFPNRTWRRRVIFDAMCDAVVALYPDLYRIASSDALSVSSTTYTEVPAGIVDDLVAVKHFLAVATGTSGNYEPFPVRLISPAPMVTSGKAIVVDVCAGGSGYLVYKAKFPRPTLDTDTLAALGIDADWQQIIILDVVAYLLAGRELDVATQERLSRQLEQQGYPAGTPSSVRDSLLRYRALKMQRAKDALRVANQVTVTMSGVAG